MYALFFDCEGIVARVPVPEKGQCYWIILQRKGSLCCRGLL